MTLTRDTIGQAALTLIQQAGLPSLSMRGLATHLGVAPGALYWHVDNKQELLALLADTILTSPPFTPTTPTPDTRTPATLANDLRTCLLAVRDGAEIVSFARALHPEDPTPIAPITHAIRHHHPHAHHPEWTARTLVHFILGYVAEEQNRSELTRAGLTQPTPPTHPTDAAFTFGVEAILRGSLHSNPT